MIYCPKCNSLRIGKLNDGGHRTAFFEPVNLKTKADSHHYDMTELTNQYDETNDEIIICVCFDCRYAWNPDYNE